MLQHCLRSLFICIHYLNRNIYTQLVDVCPSVCLLHTYRLRADYVEALVAYANALADQQIVDDAINAMERAMSLAADDADMLNNYGAFYSKLGIYRIIQ